jgi:hypothetical protein
MPNLDSQNFPHMAGVLQPVVIPNSAKKGKNDWSEIIWDG